jgi:hypothetical protein
MRSRTSTEFAALLARTDVSQAAFARFAGITPRAAEQLVPWARRRARLGWPSRFRPPGSRARGADDRPRRGAASLARDLQPLSRGPRAARPPPLFSPDGELSQPTGRLRGPTELTNEERHPATTSPPSSPARKAAGSRRTPSTRNAIRYLHRTAGCPQYPPVMPRLRSRGGDPTRRRRPRRAPPKIEWQKITYRGAACRRSCTRAGDCATL